MGPKIVHKSHCALHPLQVQWCARTALFILVCGSSRECDLRLTQMALVTLQLFSRLWQYKSQAFLCTSSCPAMACMLAFFLRVRVAALGAGNCLCGPLQSMRYGARRTQNVRPMHCGRICHLHHAHFDPEEVPQKFRARGACTALKMAKRGNNDHK